MPADDRQPRRGADRAGLAELQLDGRAQADHVAVVEHGLVDDRLAVDERGVMGLEQIALAVAQERGVVPRQVAHERDIGMAVGAGPAQDDAIVQADEIAADGVDPEEEPALGAGRLDPRQRPRRRGMREASRPAEARPRRPGRFRRHQAAAEPASRFAAAAQPDDPLGLRACARLGRFALGLRPGSTMAAACAARAPR